MVANLRCNELKEEAVALVVPLIHNINEDAHRGMLANFQKACIDLIKLALNHYEEFAMQYDKVVFEKIRKELLGLILSQLFKVFDSQLKNIKQDVFEKFDRELRKLSVKE